MCRGYSTPLQRAITDFGADSSFAEASKKIKEHYGINIPISSNRIITQKHAQKINENLVKIQKKRPQNISAEAIIGEIDGGMVPIVKFKEGFESDRRKNRETAWVECRLALAYPKGSITPLYSATFGGVDAAGQQLSYVVDLAGRNQRSKLHFVGDGAVWIKDQVDVQFGADANYLIDYFHMTEYLHKAASCCSPNDQDSWLLIQKKRMKNNEKNKVIQELESHIGENDRHGDELCGAKICYNYMIRRMDQFNYKEAIANDLPIGSGRIESGHRSVVQKRLKLAGGWWLKEKAEDMISLRVLRANNFYNNYWAKYRKSGFAAN